MEPDKVLNGETTTWATKLKNSKKKIVAEYR
jgi:hypothetical protein